MNSKDKQAFLTPIRVHSREFAANSFDLPGCHSGQKTNGDHLSVIALARS